MNHDNPTPVRVSVLHEAARLTNGDRDLEYGTPTVNLGLAGSLKKLVSAYVRRDLRPAEAEAISMILTKLARYVTGTPKRDTCVDMAAYAAILWEVGQPDGAQEAPESPISGNRSSDDCDDAAGDVEDWCEFFADYGAVDEAPVSERRTAPTLKEVAARASARRKKAEVENALKKLLRDAGVERVSVQRHINE